MVEIVTSSATELVVIVTGDAGKLVLSITVEADQPHLITGLLAQPADLPIRPTTWEDIDAAIADAAPRFTYLAAEVDDAGALHDDSHRRVERIGATRLGIQAVRARRARAGDRGR